MLVRPAGAGWETCLVKRAAQSSTSAGLWVFPGGVVREDDPAPPVAPVGLSAAEAHVRLARPPDEPPPTPQASLAYFVCAARELLEEAGILLLATGPEATFEIAAAALAERAGPAAQGGRSVAVPFRVQALLARRRVQAHTPLATAAADLGVSLALNGLIYYAHWITPEPMPQRFDTRFFVAVLPPGQQPSPDEREVTEAIWLTASEALDRNRAGALPLHFVTINHLRRFQEYPLLGNLLAFARDKPVVPTMPLTREQGDRLAPYLPPELNGAW